MNTFKISAIITAGGNSTRFGSNKLLGILKDNKSVIQKTVEKFLPYCNEIIIPCHADIKENIEQAPFFNCEKIKFAPFGKTRQESVYNALEMCSNPDFVLIHDGARPFIEKDTIAKTIDSVIRKSAVCVGVFAIDTIKITDESGKITKTIDRKTVFQAQTPQAFDYKLITNIHKKLACEEKQGFTDDASMAEYCGVDVWVVEGTPSNKKITFKEDLS